MDAEMTLTSINRVILMKFPDQITSKPKGGKKLKKKKILFFIKKMSSTIKAFQMTLKTFKFFFFYIFYAL